jgi:transcriptional regulator of heat shock response
LNREELVDVVKDVEMLPEKIRTGFWKDEENWPKVFIGKNPFVRSKEVAVVANCLKIDGENFLFLAIGPKRMDYAKPLGLFEILNKSVEEK